jgi:hypothetical protein
MELSVIFPDKYIVVDGVPMLAATLTSPDPNYRVIQWLGTKGWIELYEGERIWLDSDATLTGYFDLHATLKAARDAEIAAILATPDTPAS